MPRLRRPALAATSLIAALAGVGGDARPLLAQDPLPVDLQVRLAVQAAPEGMRDDATVQGWNADGTTSVIREGSNELVCLGPNPARESFEVSCHHVGLEPFIARGRELLAQGVTGPARTEARWREFTAGDLPIPFGSINYILTGAGFDAATGTIDAPYLRWVIYTPNATGATTGLPESPGAPGGPWLMSPGTPGAHIMISPPPSG